MKSLAWGAGPGVTAVAAVVVATAVGIVVGCQETNAKPPLTPDNTESVEGAGAGVDVPADDAGRDAR